jgi:hypothetical protein
MYSVQENSMPADKLDLISHSIGNEYLGYALEEGKQKWGYAGVVDLSKASAKLPVILYCKGFRDGVHKIQFLDVAHLGLTRVQETAERIFGNTNHDIRIARLDWCVDLLGISLLDLALYCRLARVQNCSVMRSRKGMTFYLRQSKQCAVLLYDKAQQLRSTGNPLSEFFGTKDHLTRVEIQLRGGGLPFRKFVDIERYRDIDLLPNISFWEFGRKRDGMTIADSLAAEGLLKQISEFGLQMTAKRYTAQEWAYINQKYLEPAADFPDINRLMRKSVRDWLEDRIRFPRLRKIA